MNPQAITPAEVAELQPPQQFAPLLDSVVNRTLDLSEELRKVELQEKRFSLMERQAKSISGARKLSEAETLMIIDIGASMGFGMGESLNGIDWIAGKPYISSQLRASRMKQYGYDWKFLQADAVACSIQLYRWGKSIGECSFTYAEAQRMKTTMGGKSVPLTDKDNWQNSPSDMLFARCITRAQRRFASEVLSGNFRDIDERFDLDAVVEETTMQTKTKETAKDLTQKLVAAKGNGTAAEATI